MAITTSWSIYTEILSKYTTDVKASYMKTLNAGIKNWVKENFTNVNENI